MKTHSLASWESEHPPNFVYKNELSLDGKDYKVLVVNNPESFYVMTKDGEKKMRIGVPKEYGERMLSATNDSFKRLVKNVLDVREIELTYHCLFKLR